MVRRYRREAVASLRLIPAQDSIAHRRAATFRVPLGQSQSTPTREVPLDGSPTKPLMGLVGLVGLETNKAGLVLSEPKQQVLRLSARGFRIFPCKPREKEPAICGWKQAATTDPTQLVRWFDEFPESNWGLVTGPIPAIFVLDVDGIKGLNSFFELCGRDLRQVELACATLGVRTPRGSHLYYRYPAEMRICNSAGKLAAGCDIRSGGGFVLCPPSVHPSGEPYRWLGGAEDVCIASAPAWLLERIAIPRI